MDVTREQLANALDGLWVYAKNREGTHHGQVADPVPASYELWKHLLTEPEPPGEVVDAHICCEHIEHDPELSAMAEVLRLMESGAFDGYAVIRALYPLDGPALPRVLRWFLARFPADLPF